MGNKIALKLSAMKRVAVLVIATARLNLFLYHNVANKKTSAKNANPIVIPSHCSCVMLLD